MYRQRSVSGVAERMRCILSRGLESWVNAASSFPWNCSRLMKKTHILRCRSIASLQRTVSTLPLVDFSRASHLDLFEQPARGFFSTLLVIWAPRLEDLCY